jgi:NADH-quinone oxidoreductase subunit N
MNDAGLTSFLPLLPEVFMAIAAMTLLVVGVFRGNDGTAVLCWSSIVVIGLTGIFILGLDWSKTTALNGMFVMDRFAGFMKMLVLCGLAASLSLSIRYLYQEHMARFEYPILVLFAGLGMLMMISANSLLSMYIALELQSLSLYVLATIRRDHIKSAEAGIKYFILGALASGMLLFGISLIYGFTGEISFDGISNSLAGLESPSIAVTIGLVFILVGMAFKISAVPFHMWTPDVYEGAPFLLLFLK